MFDIVGRRNLYFALSGLIILPALLLGVLLIHLYTTKRTAPS